jgi:ketosteroid isomerase-like protein
MSQENMDVLRRWIDRWNESDLDAFMDCFDAYAEVVTDPSFMEAGPFIGRTAMRDWFAGLTEPWNGRDKLVLRELFEVGDAVVLRFDWQGSGEKSGLEMSLDITTVNLMKDGRISRQQYFFDYVAALRAVGLEE